MPFLFECYLLTFHPNAVMLFGFPCGAMWGSTKGETSNVESRDIVQTLETSCSALFRDTKIVCKPEDLFMRDYSRLNDHFQIISSK